jgi:hypothetical protein
MTETTTIEDDARIERIGVENLRNLRAIQWFCDCTTDGRYALIGRHHVQAYQPGGHSHVLVDTGCVSFHKSSYCATIRGWRPSLRMAQTGRRTLLRARAIGLPINRDDNIEGYDDD